MTFVLGKRSLSRLEGVHPVLVDVVKRAISISASDFTVMQGVRPIAEQVRHVANGTSKTMKSKHLVQPDGFGHAVDLVPWIDGKPTWDEWGLFCHIATAMRLAASDHGARIIWGGVWDRPLSDLNPATAAGMANAHEAYRGRVPHGLVDGPHFEIRL